MIYIIETLLGLWIASLIRNALITRQVSKRLCRACNGHGFVDQVMQAKPLVTRKRICQVCMLRGYL